MAVTAAAEATAQPQPEAVQVVPQSVTEVSQAEQPAEVMQPVQQPLAQAPVQTAAHPQQPAITQDVTPQPVQTVDIARADSEQPAVLPDESIQTAALQTVDEPVATPLQPAPVQMEQSSARQTAVPVALTEPIVQNILSQLRPTAVTSIDGVSLNRDVQSRPDIKTNDSTATHGTEYADKKEASPRQTTAVQQQESGRMPIAAINIPVDSGMNPSGVSVDPQELQPVTAGTVKNSAGVYSLLQARQNMHGSSARMNSETTAEVTQSNALRTDVKELTTLSRNIVSSAGTSMNSEDRLDSDSDQSGFNQKGGSNTMNPLQNEQPKVARQTVDSTSGTSSEPARQNDVEQIVNQVRERLTGHELKPGTQHITLTLSPENLGELKMNLNLQGQKLSVEIVTENQAVRDAIAQHTDALKESLSRQNITMTSFDVSTGGKSSGNQSQNQNAWREMAKQQQQSWMSGRTFNASRADIPSSQAAYQRHQGTSMLDIHY